MDNADLLSQLADIHTPEAVPFWPPAPGWWVLGLLILAGLLIAALFARRQLLQRKIWHSALSELERCYSEYRQDSAPREHGERSGRRESSSDESADLRFVNRINAVLRRVALTHFPREQVASLNGDQWVAFLRTSGDSSLLDDDLAAALSQGRFARRWDVDAERLYQMARHWITSLYMPTTAQRARKRTRARPSSSQSLSASDHA